MVEVEKSASKIGDAIDLALTELNARLDEVKVDIVSNGGIFKKAKVRVRLNDDVIAAREAISPKISRTADSKDVVQAKPIEAGLDSKATTDSRVKTDSNNVTNNDSMRTVGGNTNSVNKTQEIRIRIADDVDVNSTGDAMSYATKQSAIPSARPINKDSSTSNNKDSNAKFASRPPMPSSPKDNGIKATDGKFVSRHDKVSVYNNIVNSMKESRLNKSAGALPKQSDAQDSGNNASDNSAQASSNSARVSPNHSNGKPSDNRQIDNNSGSRQGDNNKASDNLTQASAMVATADNAPIAVDTWVRQRGATPVQHDTGEHVRQLLQLMGIASEVVCYVDGKHLDIFIEASDPAIVGYRGETIDAIELMASLHANRGNGEFVSVSVDYDNFRQQRMQTLVGVATKMADKAVRTNKKIALEPMNDLQRKMIHFVLQSDNRIKTRSEGNGLARHVVIFAKR